MDTTQIFKKAWGLVWRYRALWLFGFLLALTVNNALWLGFAGRDQVPMENRIIMLVSTIRFPGEGVTIDLHHPGGPSVDIEGVHPARLRELLRDVRLSDIGAILISIGVMLLFWTLLKVLLRYTSQAALIRMVEE